MKIAQFSQRCCDHKINGDRENVAIPILGNLFKVVNDLYLLHLCSGTRRRGPSKGYLKKAIVQKTGIREDD